MSSQRNFGKSRLPAILVCFLLAVPAFGQTVDIIAGNVHSSPMYMGSPDFEVMIPSTADNVSLVGGVGFWSMSPSGDPAGPFAADFSWAGSPLLADNSLGGLASAEFGSGGVLTLTGELFGGPTAFSGLLNDQPGEEVVFQGTMSGFELEESVQNENFIKLIGSVTVTPTGGWLFDNGHTQPFYALSFIAVDAKQDGGDVEDFQDNIVMQTALEFQMVGFPEPASLGLFALAGLGLLRRKRG